MGADNEGDEQKNECGFLMIEKVYGFTFRCDQVWPTRVDEGAAINLQCNSSILVLVPPKVKTSTKAYAVEQACKRGIMRDPESGFLLCAKCYDRMKKMSLVDNGKKVDGKEIQ